MKNIITILVALAIAAAVTFVRPAPVAAQQPLSDKATLSEPGGDEGYLDAAGDSGPANATDTQAAPTQPAGEQEQATTAPKFDRERIKKMRLDIKERRIIVPGVVVLRDGYLEFLVCSGGTKAHESVVMTLVEPSKVHAALLALGLTPGRAARWSGQDEDAIFEPPAGPGLKISFRWTDAGGREHTVAASEWITAGEGSKAKPPEQWVFVGSDVRPDGRYLADRHGELISVSNFASATIDVPFESSADDALRDFVVATEKVPPQHTYVDVIIEPLPGAEKCPDARVVLEVDRLGQVLLDGKVVAMNELPQWAAKYLQDHQRGQVVLRIDPLARVGDVELAKAYLRSGGVREVVEQPLGASFYWLPRSASMARLRMIEWRDRFARPQEYIDAPDEMAANTLEVIRAQMAAMEAEKALLQEYAQQLEGLIEAHRKAQEAAETRDAD